MYLFIEINSHHLCCILCLGLCFFVMLSPRRCNIHSYYFVLFQWECICLKNLLIFLLLYQYFFNYSTYRKNMTFDFF